MSLTKKRIDYTITLGSGSFGEDVGDTVTLTGFRSMTNAEKPGGESMGMAHIRIFGLSQPLMNKLTTIGTINRAVRAKNTVSVAAGDDENGMQLLFFGVIVDAWGDYNAAPDVAFTIVAYAGLDIAIKPVGATGFKGAFPVASIMKQFADDARLTFENSGVDVVLNNPYFAGSTMDKIRACARAADINYTIDRGMLSIWKRTGARTGAVPQISADTGLVGYPVLSSKGMSLKTLFNWNINLGGEIDVRSLIPMANGRWKVFNVSHSISQEIPGGDWFTFTDCYNVE